MTKVEFIESYIKVGNDYQWHDNHGELIRCKDCKKWMRNDGTYPDFDGKEWHKCEALEQYRHVEICDTPVTPTWFYCGYAERKEE